MSQFDTKKIFLVDDSRTVAELISRSINKSLGHEVEKFPSGEAMLERLKEVAPDLILLDHYLDAEDPSAINGLEVLKKVKQAHAHLPVIMLSGHSDEKLAEELLKNGAAEFLDKHDEDILYKIEQLIPRHL